MEPLERLAVEIARLEEAGERVARTVERLAQENRRLREMLRLAEQELQKRRAQIEMLEQALAAEGEERAQLCARLEGVLGELDRLIEQLEKERADGA